MQGIENTCDWSIVSHVTRMLCSDWSIPDTLPSILETGDTEQIIGQPLCSLVLTGLGVEIIFCSTAVDCLAAAAVVEPVAVSLPPCCSLLRCQGVHLSLEQLCLLEQILHLSVRIDLGAGGWLLAPRNVLITVIHLIRES